MRDRLRDAVYAAGWGLVRHLPEPAARGLFAAVADVAWWRRGQGVRRLEANLARVLSAAVAQGGGPGVRPERVRALSRAGMRSYLRYWCEAFRLPGWDGPGILARIEVPEEERLRTALGAGRGVVAVLPHMGNWDLAGAWAATVGLPLATVAERLEPAALFDRFVAYRERLGLTVLPLGDPEVFGLLARRLRQGGLVALLGDRDLTATGVPVCFFGATARMPAGPAALAVQTGAALLPVTLWYDGPRLHVQIHPAVPDPGAGSRADRIATMTQQVARVFEAAVAAHPADWHMLARLWPDEPPAGEDEGRPVRIGA